MPFNEAARMRVASPRGTLAYNVPLLAFQVAGGSQTPGRVARRQTLHSGVFWKPTAVQTGPVSAAANRYIGRLRSKFLLTAYVDSRPH